MSERAFFVGILRAINCSGGFRAAFVGVLINQWQ